MKENPVSEDAKHTLEGEFPLQPQGRPQILRGLPPWTVLLMENYLERRSEAH